MKNRLSLNLVQVLERHYLELTQETGISKLTFVANMRERYLATFPESARTLEFSANPDAVRRMVADELKVRGWFDDTVSARFPAEMLESFIAAFPPERRFRLQLELAERQGLLAVPMPEAAASEDSANFGRIGKEVGEMIIRISALLDDNEINALDADKAPAALRDIDEAVAVILEMRARIKRQALGE